MAFEIDKNYGKGIAPWLHVAEVDQPIPAILEGPDREIDPGTLRGPAGEVVESRAALGGVVILVVSVARASASVFGGEGEYP